MSETYVMQGGVGKYKEKFGLKSGKTYAYEMGYGIKIGVEEIGRIGVTWNQLVQVKIQWETVGNNIRKYFGVHIAKCVMTK
jgi:hypothetical protein